MEGKDNNEDPDKKESKLNSGEKQVEFNEITSSNSEINLSRKMRWIIFVFLIFIIILTDIDQGTLSSS